MEKVMIKNIADLYDALRNVDHGNKIYIKHDNNEISEVVFCYFDDDGNLVIEE